MIEFRVRNRVAAAEMEAKVGKVLIPEDVSIMPRGPVRILQPDGSPLCVYLPGAISEKLREESFPILHEMKNSYTSNRGMASGSKRIQGASNRSYARAVDSAIVGSFDAQGPEQYCRLTAWTGRETEKWRGLWPLLQRIGELMEQHVPERYAAQVKQSRDTAPEWVIPGTPFTTVTVNNTYPTGVHQDKGDLDEGFSTLVTFRNGDFEGGWLCFPEYRIGVDMQDRDLLLMDAHAWHGNTQFSPEPEREANGRLKGDPGFERISIVSYFRTNMVKCGSAEDEAARASIFSENNLGALTGD